MPPESCHGYLRSKPERLTSLRYCSTRSATLRGIESHDLERQHHVALDRAPRIKRGRLEDVAVVPLHARCFRRNSIDQDRPGGGTLEVGDDAQQRGLAAARWADEGDEIALSNIEVDVRQCLDLAVRRLEGQRDAHARLPRALPACLRRCLHELLGRGLAWVQPHARALQAPGRTRVLWPSVGKDSTVRGAHKKILADAGPNPAPNICPR